MAKKEKSKTDIKKGSLKLREMVKATTDDNAWRESTYKKHGEEMLKKLARACGITSD